MFENRNASEKELLSLMLNKDEFLQYITHQYNNSKRCTLLNPVIWAIHFNIPKYQRLQLLEKILLENIKYIKTCYSFLPEKQILGKTYEVLGIPTIFGELDKCFLNTYKKFKSYYPVKCPKSKKTPVLNNNNLIETDTSLNYSYRYSPKLLTNQKIISSTPNAIKIPRFEMYPLLSPIRIPIKNECSILSTDLLYNSNRVLNVQNITHNNYYDSPHILSTTLELSGFDILNNSQQTFYEPTNLNSEQSQMYFISRDPGYNEIKSDNSQLDMSNLSNMKSEKFSSNETEYSNNYKTSVYFDNSKKIKYKESKFKNASIINQKNSSSVLIQSLSKRLSKNLQNNSAIRKQILNISNIKIPKLENNKCKTKQSHSKTSISEPQTWIKQTFSDMSFSDLDKTTQPITMKMLYSPNNKIEHDSIKLEFNDTWEKHMNSMDIELQDYNDEESVFSVNSSTQVPNLPDHDINNESNVYSISNMSSITFSDDSIKLTRNSHQLDSIKHDVKKLPQDSFDSNDYEEKNILQTDNNVNTLFNNIQFEEMSYSISQENLTMNLSSTFDISSSN